MSLLAPALLAQGLVPPLALALAPQVPEPPTPDTQTLHAALQSGAPQAPLGARPRGLLEHGGLVWFTAQGTDGRELWSSDGTAAGTQQVDDLRAGPESGLPFASLGVRSYEPLPGSASQLVLAGDDGALGLEPYRCDGPQGPFVSLGDLASGPSSSTPEDFTAHQGALWFLADDGVHGRELWSTDGTPGGTQLELDFAPGADSAWGAPSSRLDGRLASLGGALLLALPAPGGGLELWSTDGSGAGTQSVALFPSATELAPFQRQRHAELGGRVVFPIESEDESVRGVWSSDGSSAGTFRLYASDALHWMVRDGARAYVVSELALESELRITDGSPLGTTQLAGPGLDLDQVVSTPGVLDGGVLYFGARGKNTPQGNVGVELARSDGTLAGTRIEADLLPGASSSGPRDFGFFAGEVYFVAWVTVGAGRELHRYDPGTGTAQLAGDHGLGIASMQYGEYAGTDFALPLAAATHALLHPAYELATGTELRASAPAGWSTLDIESAETASSQPEQLVRVGGRVFFLAESGGAPNQGELFYLDAVQAGPPQLVLGPQGQTELDPERLVPFRGGVAVLSRWDTSGSTTAYMPRVWWTDGDQSVQLSPPDLIDVEEQLAATEERLFFVARAADTGRELWVSEGGAFDAQPIDFSPGTDSSLIGGLVTVGERAFYDCASFGEQGGFGRELHVSDGTLEGTQLVADLWPGASSSFPTSLTAVGERVYFSATTPGFGRELWVSDGTLAGTEMVVELQPGSGYSQLASLVPHGSGVAFVYDFGQQRAPYVSDGTAAGTVPLLAQTPVAESQLGPLLDVDGTLYFPWGASGQLRLFASDGTALGTQALAATGPQGLRVSEPVRLAALGAHTLGAVLADHRGDELWARAAGADFVPLADALGGSDSGHPSELLQAGGRVWFAADTPSQGRELHAVALAQAGIPAAVPLGGGCGSAATGLSSAQVPSLGQPLTLELASGVPTAPAILWVDTDMLPLAAPGECRPQLPNSIELFSVSSDASGVASFPLQVPNDPQFVGLAFYFRGAAVAAGEPFLGLLSLSNVLEVVPGA